MGRIDNGHNRFAVRSEGTRLRMPPLWGKVPAMRGPPTLEPLPIEIAPKTNGARGVGVQFWIRRRGNGGG